MAKRTYVANAPLVAQVDRIEITAEQYLVGQIAEGSDLRVTINDKAILATVPYIENGAKGSYVPIDDGNAVRALLQDLAEKWNGSDIPEFREITCSQPQQNDNDDWFVELTARVPGVPFDVTVESIHPTIDVDTLRDGAPGVGEIQSFYLSPVPPAGTYRVLWDLGAGIEASGVVDFDADASTIGAAMAAGMPSLTPDNFAIKGSGTESAPFIVSLSAEAFSRDVPPLMIEATSLEGNGEVTVSTISDGAGGSSDAVGCYAWQTGAFPDLIVYTDFGGEIFEGWNTGDTSASLTAKIEALPNVGAGNVEIFVVDTDNPLIEGRAIGWRAKGALGGKTVGVRIIPQVSTLLGYYTNGAEPVQQSSYFMSTSGTGGAFTLTVDGETTAPIPYNAGYGLIATAISDLPSVTGSDFTIVGYHVSNQNPIKTWGIFFFSPREMTLDDSGVTGGSMILDVMSEGATSEGVNERQAIYTNGLAGTFTLSKPAGATSAGLSPVSTTDQIKAAVEGLYGGTWTVTGSGIPADPWIAEAGGALAGVNLGQMLGDGANLTGASRGVVGVVTEGSEGVFEQWSVAIHGADGGTFRLSFRDHDTAEIPFGASAATVAAALDALDNLAGVAVSGSGTLESPYIIDIEDETYFEKNLRQLVAWNENLTGVSYPVVTHTTTQAAEGPWHWNLSLNWWNADAGVYGIPQNGDDLYFEMGSERRCPRYDLDQSDLTVVGLTFLANFSDNATVGLPRWNPLGYWEYRETTLKINLSGDGPITVGSRGGGGSPLMNFNTFNSKTTFRIHNTASPIAGEFSAIQWEGTNPENTVELLGGFFGAAPYAGQVAALAKITQRDGAIITGAGCSIGDIDKTAGELLMDRSPVSGTIEIQG